jgi:hypothetical protein
MSYIKVFHLIYSLTVSNLNSLATVTWEDFISQIPQFRSFTDKRQLLLIKVIGKSALYYLQWQKWSKFLLQDICPQMVYYWLSTSIIVIDTNLLTFMTFNVEIIPLKVKVSWCFLTADLQLCTVLMWEQDKYLSLYCPESYTNCKSYIYLKD